MALIAIIQESVEAPPAWFLDCIRSFVASLSFILISSIEFASIFWVGVGLSLEEDGCIVSSVFSIALWSVSPGWEIRRPPASISIDFGVVTILHSSNGGNFVFRVGIGWLSEKVEIVRGRKLEMGGWEVCGGIGFYHNFRPVYEAFHPIFNLAPNFLRHNGIELKDRAQVWQLGEAITSHVHTQG